MVLGDWNDETIAENQQSNFSRTSKWPVSLYIEYMYTHTPSMQILIFSFQKQQKICFCQSKEKNVGMC